MNHNKHYIVKSLSFNIILIFILFSYGCNSDGIDKSSNNEKKNSKKKY